MLYKAVKMMDSLQIDPVTITSIALFQSQALGPVLLALAADGHISIVEKLYHSLPVADNSTLFWRSRFGPRLIYLLLAQGWSALASELAKDMVASVCHCLYVVPDKWHDTEKMMRIFCLMSFLDAKLSNNNEAHAVYLSLRLMFFILHSCAKKDLFFHLLCKSGMYDLVQCVVECMHPGTLKLAFEKLDDRNMSALYHATAKGHLDVVELLVESGCPVTHPDPKSLPELFAAVVCLQFSLIKKPGGYNFYHHLREDSEALIPRETSLSLIDRQIQLHFTSTSQTTNAACVVEFYASRSKNDLPSIMGSRYFIAALSTICFLPSLTLAAPLLDIFHKNLDLCALSKTFEPRSLTNRLFQITKLLPLPHASSKTCLQLLDYILIRLIDWDLPFPESFPKIASRKGLWKVVQRFLTSPHLMSLCDLSEILSDAVQQCESNVLASICSALQTEGKLSSGHLLHPLCVAARCDQLETVKSLLSYRTEPVLVEPLAKAIRFYRGSITDALLTHIATAQQTISAASFSAVVKVAARCNNHHAVEKLHSALTNGLTQTLPPFGDRSFSFWYAVLAGAAECGHEYLSLQAVGCLSESQLKQIQTHVDCDYPTLLNWCCYWGMKDLLECLPFATSALLKATDPSGVSPWMSAMIGGNISKLSYLDRFPSLDAVIESKDPMVELMHYNMLYGAFDKLVSRTVREHSCHDFNWYPAGKDINFSFKVLLEAVCFGVAETVEVYMEHLGRYAGEYILLLKEKDFNLLSIACSKRNNLPVVELILKCLFNSPNHSKNDFATEFVLSVRRGEVEYAEAFVRSIPNLFVQSWQSHHLLNAAVCSNKPEMVDYILNLLGDDAPDECFLMNEHYEYPLFSAFAFGHLQVVCKSTLIDTASKSPKYHKPIHPDWRVSANQVHGWFDLLMRSNTITISAPDLNVESTSCSDQPVHSMLSLRTPFIYGQFNALMLLHLAVTHQASSLAEVMISASDGTFVEIAWDKRVEVEVKWFAEVLIDPTIQMFMSARYHCRNYLNSLQLHNHEAVRVLLRETNKCCGFEEKTIAILDIFQLYDSSAIEQSFLQACRFGKSRVINYLLSLSNHTFDDSVMAQGLSAAIANGHLEVAADLKLSSSDQTPCSSDCGQVCHYIFNDVTYHNILNSFFSSLHEPCQRMPLASQWLVHNWSEKEAQLVVKKLSCSTYAPPNPWVFTHESQDLTITVDWDSFSESLLTSPSVPSSGPESKYHHVPLLVEAMVFSRAVLGQVIPLQCSKIRESHDQDMHGKTSLSFFSRCKTSNLSSLIVSCVVWPSLPSFSTFADSQAILTISYQPHTRTIVFPEPVLAIPSTMQLCGSLPESCDDSLLSPDSSLYSSVDRLAQRLQNLGAYYERKIASELVPHRRCRVTVKFSSDIVDTDSYEMLEFHHMLASAKLSDITNALKLASNPSSALYRQLRGFSSASTTPKTLVQSHAFEILAIAFEVDFRQLDGTTLSTFDISLDDSTLSIVVYLPGKHEALEVHTRSFYEKLADGLSEHIFKAEVLSVQNQIVNEIGEKIAPLLKSSLNLMSSSPDILKLTVEDEHGKTCRFSDIDLTLHQNVIYFSSLNKLKLFLCSFCRMLKVFLYKPRLRADLSSLFEAGFQVKLTKSPESEFFTKLRMANLTMSVDHLLSGRFSASLQHLSRQVLSSSLLQRGQHLENFLPRSVPAPFLSFVDDSQSYGHLYPVKGSCTLVTVQLADYNGTPINATPSVNCCLDVQVKHVHLKSVTKASSSSEPSPNSASKRLMVKEGSAGTFKIEWVPREHGLHMISLCVNDMPIRGSPYACLCSTSSSSCGLRHTTTDSPAVFVVLHSSTKDSHLCRCLCNMSQPPPVKLFNKKPINPLAKTSANSNRDQFVRELEIGDRPVHHISLCSAYGGARNWLHVPSAFVSVHISRDGDWNSDKQFNSSHFGLKVSPLGKGGFSVSLHSTIAGSFSIFASCTYCNSVLNMLWKNGGFFLPVSLDVVPGGLSVKHSVLKVVPPFDNSLPLHSKGT